MGKRGGGVPTLNLYVHFYVMMKGIEKSLLVIWSFWMPFKRILETISHILSLWTQSEFTFGREGHATLLCYDKGNEKSLVIWSFWKPFKKILETILVSCLYEHSQNLPEVEGDSLPQGKVPPPSTLMYSFHFYVMIKGIEKSLVIWSFWMAFKRIQETISHILSLWIQSEFTCGWGGHTLLWGKVSPHLYPHVCFHFYLMIKGMRRALLFEVFESPSRRYWKQFHIISSLWT